MKKWKNFKKNEIVIYATALMLVTAGYFNYTTNIKEETAETSATSETNIVEEANIGDARLVSNNEVISSENKENKGNNEIDIALSTEEPNDETVDTSAPAETNTEYFTNSKLEREQRYAGMLSSYTKILEDNSVSETQKAIAMTEITKINNAKNAISVCENLLSTKGFTNSLILVNGDSVNVVIESEKNLSTEQVAQIQNIVSREFGTEIINIHISIWGRMLILNF